MEVSLAFVSVGCNQTPHSIDWNCDGLLAYAAGNSVAVAEMCQVSYPCFFFVCFLQMRGRRRAGTAGGSTPPAQTPLVLELHQGGVEY